MYQAVDFPEISRAKMRAKTRFSAESHVFYFSIESF